MIIHDLRLWFHDWIEQHKIVSSKSLKHDYDFCMIYVKWRKGIIGRIRFENLEARLHPTKREQLFAFDCKEQDIIWISQITL